MRPYLRPSQKLKALKPLILLGFQSFFLRSVADLNCCTRFCRQLPNRSANRPFCDFAWQR